MPATDSSTVLCLIYTVFVFVTISFPLFLFGSLARMHSLSVKFSVSLCVSVSVCGCCKRLQTFQAWNHWYGFWLCHCCLILPFTAYFVEIRWALNDKKISLIVQKPAVVVLNEGIKWKVSQFFIVYVHRQNKAMQSKVLTFFNFNSCGVYYCAENEARRDRERQRRE